MEEIWGGGGGGTFLFEKYEFILILVEKKRAGLHIYSKNDISVVFPTFSLLRTIQQH